MSATSSEIKKSYGVLQYCTSVKNLLKTRIPAIWVHGVITQISPRGGLIYLVIAEYADSQEKPTATLNISCYSSDWIRLNHKTMNSGQGFEISPEMKVSVYLEADFYAPQGKFQPRIIDIDPNYTLGEMAQTRLKIIERLQQENLLKRNKSIELTKTPLKIGLITAPNSAAYNDFCNLINYSPFSCEIIFHEAKMQGQDTENTVCFAIAQLIQHDLDILCIVRGGGAKTDLVYFDSEKICRAIANCPIPVLTGIGHQIDSSLADLVAWDNKMTPTDCARFIVERLGAEWQNMLFYIEKLKQIWNQEQNSAQYQLDSHTASLPKMLKNRLLQENTTIQNHRQHLQLTWKSVHTRENSKCNNAPHFIVKNVQRLFNQENEKLSINAHGLAKGSHKITHFFHHHIKNAHDKLLFRTLNAYRMKKDRLNSIQNQLKWSDPVHLLNRGFAMLRDVETHKILRAKQIQIGSNIQIHTEGFTLNTLVQSIKKDTTNE